MMISELIDRLANHLIARVTATAKRIPIGPGGADDPTYWRWFVIPRNRLVNIYLHNFLKDDEEDLHDHRMINISFILFGGYFDERFIFKPVKGLALPKTKMIRRPEHSLTIRLPSTPHRVVLQRDPYSHKPVPSWSLFIGFPHWRNWGFWCGNPVAHWIPYQMYVSDSDPLSPGYGKPGKGCG